MKKRGRKPGQLQNARDQRGWMVPRPGTVRHQVYELLVAGLTRSEIASKLDLTLAGFDRHREYIMRWWKTQEWRKAAEVREPRYPANARIVGIPQSDPLKALAQTYIPSELI